LLQGTDIETPNAQGTEIWSATLKTLSEQPGFQRAYYGRRTEDPNFLQLCIGKFEDWLSSFISPVFQNSVSFLNIL